MVQVMVGLGLALLVTATPAAATPGRAARLTALTDTLDALLDLERPDGGWTYEQGEGVRPRPSSWPLRIAEAIAGPLGLAAWDTVVLRSPGTSAAGLVLLDAYALTGRAAYLTAARRAGDVVLAAQLRSGGWFAEAPMEGDALAPWFSLSVWRASLDDDVTPGAVRLMVALWQRTGERRYWYAASRGVALLRAAQLPSGAWPLVWRPAWKRALVPTFEDWATLNDGATSLVIETLLVAGAALERADLVRAAERGGDWLIAARRPPPYAGWAQQYDAAGEPARARRFEPPALATWESRYAMEALLALAAATGDRRYCAPLAAAADWLAHAAIGPGCWARFYDLATGAPVYVDDEGRHVAAPAAAHQPYAWHGDFGVRALLRRLAVAPEKGTRGRGGTAVRPIAGDPVRCRAGDVAVPDARATRDPRRILVQAARLLAALQPAPVDPCR